MKLPTIRGTSAFGAVARRRLRALCDALARRGGAFGSSTETLDGYILRASKVSGRVAGQLLDIPHRIGWGGFIAAYHYPDAHASVQIVFPALQLPTRDALLVPAFGQALEANAETLERNRPNALVPPPKMFRYGTFPGAAAQHHRENAVRLGSLCYIESAIYMVATSQGKMQRDRWSNLSGSEGAMVECALYRLPAALGRFDEEGRAAYPAAHPDDTVSIQLTDAFVQSRIGARLVNRVSPPSTTATIDGNTVAGQRQLWCNGYALPWCTALAIHRASGIVRWFIATQVRRQVNFTDDQWGERSVYLLTLDVIGTGVEGEAAGAYLVHETERRNLTDSVAERRPYLDDASTLPIGHDGAWHRENNHTPWQLVQVSAAYIAAYAMFHVERVVEGVGAPYFTTEVILISTSTGAVAQTFRLLDAVPWTEAEGDDYLWSVGGAAPGEGYAEDATNGPHRAVFITRSRLAGRTHWAAVQVTIADGGASVAQQTFSTDFYLYGSGAVQNHHKVEYIGNGKYVFPASSFLSVQTPSAPDMLGDFYLAVYDSVAGTMVLGGQIEPAQLVYDASGGECPTVPGRPCCVQKELVDAAGEVIRPATVLATIGADTGIARGLTNEAGRTYISYDSCQTWHKVADIGSSTGVFYGGNPAFRPPLRQLVGGAA